MSNLPPRPARLTRYPLRFDLIVVAAIVLLAFWLYAPSLHYPFVWYDADDLLRAIKYPVETLFSGVPNYQYYRPLIFTFWKLILNTWGADSAPMFHAYLIGGHLLNAVLLYALTRALTRSRSMAAMAALLFTVYPFSYQAVTWIIAHQPPSLIGVLAGLLIYTKVRSRPPDAGRKRLRWHLAALALLAASMLLHETGFVSAGLIVLIEAYLVLTKRVAQISRWPLVYIGVTGALYLVYAAAAKSSPPQAAFEVSTGLYLLQGLVYPAAMLLARVCQPASCNLTAWLLPVGVIFLIGLAVFWKLQRTLLIGLFGVLWFLGGILPMWAGRDFVYNAYAPRLLYLAGCGACIAIAASVGRGANSTQESRVPPEPSQARPARLRLARTAAFGLIAVILLQSTWFVFRRQGLYDDAFALLTQENNAMFAPREGPALFINTVELVAFKDQELPLGWFGALVSPWHNRIVTDRNLRALNADWAIDPAQAQQVQDRAPLSLEFHGQTLPLEQLQARIVSATQVFRIEAPRGDLRLYQIGKIEHAAAPPTAAVASWPDDVRLISATIDTEAGAPVLNLDWSIGGAIDPDVTVFVHVLNGAGQVVAQADGDLVGGYVPIGLWQKDDRVRERRPLLLPDRLPGGTYTVIVGLYQRATQQRLTPAQSNLPVNDNALRAGQFEHP
jgi:hypothetical protein